MGNLISTKSSFLKQWFVVGDGPNEEGRIIYHISNNHYIHGWLKERGYSNIKNNISFQHINELIHVLNQPNFFEQHFPDRFISDYSLWDIDTDTHWYDIDTYKTHTKKQLETLKFRLQGLNDSQLKNINYVICY